MAHNRIFIELYLAKKFQRMKSRSVKEFPKYSVDSGGNWPVERLLLTDVEVKLIEQNPEKFVEEVHVRATQMSRVLEDFLRESHGEPRWGLND